MSQIISLNQIAGRSCGECQACCEIKDIKETNSPLYNRCKHQCDSGCSIYKDRPKPCRDYSCLWLQGIVSGDDRRRPDRLGLMFDVTGTEGAMGQKLVAWETRPGAADEDQCKYVLNKIATSRLVIVKRFGGATGFAVGPRTEVQKFYSIVNKQRT
jgi:hypothetical protein